MYRIIFTVMLLSINLTSAGLIASSPILAGPALTLDHAGPAIAVKHAVATSYANSNLVALHPSVVQVAHSAPIAVQAAPTLVHAAPLTVVSNHGLGLGGLGGLGGLDGVGILGH